MNVKEARFNMVEQQIRPWNVLNEKVLQTLFKVKREDFVPAIYKDLAFADVELPLAAPGNNASSQVMLAPKVEARILQDAAPKRHEMVLEVGTGSGYMAALLAHDAKNVLSFETSAALAEIARDNLQKAQVKNVQVMRGDVLTNLTKHDKFDLIVISGSLPSVPMELLKYLNPKGRMLCIIGEEPVMQATLVKHVKDEQYESVSLWDTLAPRLEGFSQTEPSKFVF